MKIPKQKKQKNEDLDDADDNRPVRFDALAELTSSEVVAQVKLGMSCIAPETDSEIDEDVESDEQAA